MYKYKQLKKFQYQVSKRRLNWLPCKTSAYSTLATVINKNSIYKLVWFHKRSCIFTLVEQLVTFSSQPAECLHRFSVEIDS